LGDEPYQLPDRGGNWNNGTNAGVFALNLNNARSNSNNNRGFRSALLSLPEACLSREQDSAERIKGFISLPTRQKTELL
jgi:hypothetical protein